MEYKREKKREQRDINNDSTQIHSTKTPLDNSMTYSQNKNNEPNTINQAQLSSFLSLTKIRLFNIITFIKQINTQIIQAQKINSSYNDILTNSSESKSESGGNVNMFKRKKVKSTSNLHSNPKYSKEMEELSKFFQNDLETQKTKKKIDNDNILSQKKKELDSKIEELVSNNNFISNNLEEEFYYFQEECNRIKNGCIEDKISENVIEKVKENLQKYINMKKYIINEYYQNCNNTLKKDLPQDNKNNKGNNALLYKKKDKNSFVNVNYKKK